VHFEEKKKMMKKKMMMIMMINDFDEEDAPVLITLITLITPHAHKYAIAADTHKQPRARRIQQIPTTIPLFQLD